MTTPIRIELLANDSRERAELILDGVEKPRVKDFEVIVALVELCRERGEEAVFFRRGEDGWTVQYTLEQMELAIQTGIELRPSPPKE